jgi:hypothetical protein
MNMTPSDQLILTVLRQSDPSGASTSGISVPAGVDWEGVLRIFAENKIVRAASRCLMSEPAVPRVVKQQLAAMGLQVQSSSEGTISAFESVLPYLEKLDDLILLKGTAFWYDLYKGSRFRHVGDIDLLMDKIAPASVRGRLLDHYPVPQEVSSRVKNLFLEFHHDFNVFGGFLVLRIDMRGLRDRCRFIQVGGCSVGLLSPEDDFLYIAYHNVREGFCGLYRFLDLREIIRRNQLDWQVIQERAIQWGLARSVWSNGLALSLLFGEGLPDKVLLRLAPRPLMQKLLTRLLNLDLLVRDPNPTLPSSHRSITKNWKKQVLVLLVLVNPWNWHKLLVGRLVHPMFGLYRALIKVAGLGVALKVFRMRFPQ